MSSPVGAGRPPRYQNRVIFPLPLEREDKERFLAICARERVEASAKIQGWIKDYNKKHLDGNPAHSLDKWNDNPRFEAFPTLGEDPDKYLKGMSSEMLREIRVQAQKWVNAFEDRVIPEEPVKDECPECHSSEKEAEFNIIIHRETCSNYRTQEQQEKLLEGCREALKKHKAEEEAKQQSAVRSVPVWPAH